MDYQARRSRSGRVALCVYRFGHWVRYKVRARGIKMFLWIMYKLVDLIIVRAYGNSEIPASAYIGKGLRLPHLQGIVINHHARIGDNVTIFHQVTIGIRDTAGECPTIGDDVFVCAGAKLLGPIRIGDGQ